MQQLCGRSIYKQKGDVFQTGFWYWNTRLVPSSEVLVFNSYQSISILLLKIFFKNPWDVVDEPLVTTDHFNSIYLSGY